MALWTLASNAVVFSGGSLRTLAWVFAGLFVACGGLLWIRHRGRRRNPAPLEKPAPVEAPEPPRAVMSPRADAVERVFVFAIACTAVGLSAWRENALYLWLIGMPLSIWCVWRTAAMGSLRRPPLSGRRQAGTLWAIALSCMALTLVAQRPDLDDAFYVNLAVHAADHPDAALLVGDTMHGIPGLPLSLAVYRIQSYELLGGLLAWLTPLRALDCFHVLFPALVALAIPFGLAALLRFLTPRVWVFGVLFGVLFLFGSGTPGHGFGNFSFMRLQQGKSILLSLIIPLVCFYGLRFAHRPRLREGVLLAAIQVAALGTNATAIWIAPTCAFLAVCVGLRPASKSWRILGSALLCSTYPLLAGVLMSATTTLDLEATGKHFGIVGPLHIGLLVGSVAAIAVGLSLHRIEGRSASALGLLGALALALWVVFIGWVKPGDPVAWLQSYGLGPPTHGRILRSFEKVLDYGWSGSLFAVALLGGWAVAVDSLHRRFCAFFTCAFFVAFWNPFLAEHLGTKVTGGPTYWRVFWILPAAAWIGATWAALIDRVSGERRGMWTSLLVVSACLTLVFAPVRTTLSPESDVAFRKPGWRIHPAEREVISLLMENAGPGDWVLAPRSISAWLPAQHEHPFPLVVRPFYMRNLKGTIGDREITRRKDLARMVEGLEPMNVIRLLSSVSKYGLTAICVTNEVAQPLLESADWGTRMELSLENDRYQVWLRR